MNESIPEKNEEKEELYCLDCDKYFNSIKSFNEEHEKTVYKVLNKTHKYINSKSSLQIIAKLFKSNKLLSSAIKEQQKEINELSKRLDIYEDSFKDVFFDCNIAVKNGNKKLLNMGKCSLQFFPRNIYFRIECKGEFEKDEKNKFQIDIIFPFRQVNLKQCSIEKMKGCYLSQEFPDGEGNPITYYHNYLTFIEQNNYIISIKSLRDYILPGKFEKQSINVIINGILNFNSLIGNVNVPIILYNILDKKFLCYEDYQWKFIDNFVNENDDLNKNCLIYFLVNEDNKVHIKGEHKYLGFKPNYATSDEKESLLDINFLNKIYGLVEISKNGKYLTTDKEGKIIYGTEKTFFLICNI